MIEREGDKQAERETDDEGFATIKEAFEANHAIEFVVGHANGFEDGEFFGTQGDVGSDSIKDIGDTDEGNDNDEAIKEDFEEKDETLETKFFLVDVAVTEEAGGGIGNEVLHIIVNFGEIMNIGGVKMGGIRVEGDLVELVII